MLQKLCYNDAPAVLEHIVVLHSENSEMLTLIWAETPKRYLVMQLSMILVEFSL